MAQVMSLKREGWIDQYRGILFLFVIVYHTFQSPIWLRYFFDFFFLPGFFFLSGYLFRAKGIKNNFLSIVNGLLIPFALFSCLISLYIAFSSGNLFVFIETFYDYFVKGGDGIWFIPCLIIVEAIFSIYMNSVKDEKWRILFMLIFFVASFIICRTTKYHLPWNVDTAILGATFFLMGNISKSFTIPGRLISISFFIFYIITSQFVGYSLYNNVDVDLHNNVVGNPFVYLVLSAIASFSLFSVCKNMPVCWYFRKLGQYTLFAFPFHPFIYRSIVMVFDIVGGANLITTIIIAPLITGLLIILVCSFLEKYAPYLIGKFKYIKLREKVISNCSE